MRAPYLLNGVSRRKQTGAAWCAREKPRTPGSAGVGGKWRMGVSLESDRGSHFNNEVIKLLCSALNIEQKLHRSYRPEASGLVEQMNGTLKLRMAKMCASTNLKWPAAL
ncbi:hypothetical protein NDU88_006885 [Pleurodeles waltl]|uniref:Integrase catalytic domain-containing protein n=1 Tax=Pleurodeles waltl TaxID=8319 RepID=A0AAV7VN61_PLEWA|nr:hypothetical protein NDU88_006885 [Pleurodeles waltl]